MKDDYTKEEQESWEGQYDMHEWFTVRGAVIAIELERKRREGEREHNNGNPSRKHYP